MTAQKMKIFSGLSILILFSAIGCAAGPFPAAATTEVIAYVPPDVPRDECSGSCWTGSIAAPRGGAWRCMVGNAIFDPCFVLGPDVVCGADPAGAKPGFRLVLEKPLPPAGSAFAEPGTGWLIRLADGRICNRATGARGMVAGRMTTYYCTSKNPDESAAVLGELKTGEVWTAEIAVMERISWSIKERKVVPVVRVWQ